MNEKDLAAIESRILDYPMQAQRDILRLTAELRRVNGYTGIDATAGSPYFDPVTGLLSAGAYGVRFAGAMTRATRQQKTFAVMTVRLALAALKPEIGAFNAALKIVAGRLERCVRAADTLARISQESFALILEDVPQDGQVSHIIDKVQRALSEPVIVGAFSTYADADLTVKFYPTSERRLSAPSAERSRSN